MKKIILSVAVAAMALSTTASALEDIKVSGQAKLWYETNDVNQNDLFHKDNASGEMVFKLGMTGKQGNVGFGAEVTQGSTMGLENILVSAVRTNTTELSGTGDMYVSKAYFTAPIGSATLKMGRQELNTPLLFTEKWNAQQNNFDAAVVIAPVNDNLTIVAAYAGQVNTSWSWKADSSFSDVGAAVGADGAYALGVLAKTDAISANLWAYEVTGVAKALWVDASMKAGPVALKAYAATMMAADHIAPDDTTAFALSAGMKAGEVNLFAAASMVSEDNGLAVANIGTGMKKTKLPTAGVYTDGLYVAQPGSTAVKVKAATKLGSTGVALQAVMNMNDYIVVGGEDVKETTEVDLIVTQKLADFNLKAILMHRSFDGTNTDDTTGGIHARVIASVNF